MTDDRFFQRRGPFSLSELASHCKAEIAGTAPPGLLLRGIATLETAEPDEISVFCDVNHAGAFAVSRAGAIVTSAKLAKLAHNGAALLIVRDPRYAFAAVGLMYHPRSLDAPGVSASAVLDPSAEIGECCRIEPGAVIGPKARIGAGCHIGANAVIGSAVDIGADSVIGSNTHISHALLGVRVRIGAGTVVGGEGFGVVLGPAGLLCSAQVGRVLIGDNVRIGGNCTIDRGALGDTVIGSGTMLDNLIQIGHNVHIGCNCIFAGQAGVAGSVTIGDNVLVGGAVSISDHITIGSNVRIAGKSGILRDIADGETVAGYPAISARQWHRNNLLLARAGRKPETNA